MCHHESHLGWLWWPYRSHETHIKYIKKWFFPNSLLKQYIYISYPNPWSIIIIWKEASCFSRHEFGQYELKIPIRGWKSSKQASAGIIRKLLEGFTCLLSHTTNNILLVFKSYPLNISPLNFYFYTKIPAFMTMKIEVLFGIVRIYCFFL